MRWRRRQYASRFIAQRERRQRGGKRAAQMAFISSGVGRVCRGEREVKNWANSQENLDIGLRIASNDLMVLKSETDAESRPSKSETLTIDGGEYRANIRKIKL
jgi:hypothetical protein